MNDLFSLKGKTALITGGNKGLGLAMARGFAAHGASIVITGRNEEELSQAKDKIQAETGAHVTHYVVDLGDRAQVAELIEKVNRELDRVDILVNNAGSNKPQLVTDIEDEVYDQIMEVSVRAQMALARGFAPRMIENKWGRILNISSIMAEAPLPGRTAYAASRAAIQGQTKAWARDLGPHGITVNCIVPGPFKTELPMRVLTDEQKQGFTDHTILGRWGEPEEVAGPALMLVSDAGSNVTGECLHVDGGYRAM